jgi:hypothetical protein
VHDVEVESTVCVVAAAVSDAGGVVQIWKNTGGKTAGATNTVESRFA